MIENYFCKIFVNTDYDRPELVELLSERLNGVVDLGHYIDTKNSSIDVLNNDDVDVKKQSLEDAFLYYPYYLEIDKNEKSTESSYIKEIAELMNMFKQKGIEAVAACDFEEMLGGQIKQAR